MTLQVAKLPKVGVYLYMMCFTGRIHEPLRPIKIGITGNVPSRLRAVQTGCHRRVQVLAAFLTPHRYLARELESGLHEIYAQNRLEGEWFDVDPIEALEGICAFYRSAIGKMDDVISSSPEDRSSIEIASRVGVQHFEDEAYRLRIRRYEYALKSNVRAIA